MSDKFKAGDKVYFPHISNKLFTLLEDMEHGLFIKFLSEAGITYYYELLPNGKAIVPSDKDILPKIFRPTKENKDI